jgi:hypothetical protein
VRELALRFAFAAGQWPLPKDRVSTARKL